jgi:hypothetical protein
MLELKPFDFDSFAEVNQQYIKGLKTINITATALMFKVFIRILKNIS